MALCSHGYYMSEHWSAMVPSEIIAGHLKLVRGTLLGDQSRSVIMSMNRRGTDESTWAFWHINALLLTFRPQKMIIRVVFATSVNATYGLINMYKIISYIKKEIGREKLRKVRVGFEGAPIARFFQPNLLNLHRPPKVFGQSCLPVVMLHVQCFGIHISSLYGPIILIFSSIWQQYNENIYHRFSENRIYLNTRNIEIEKS